MSRRPFASIAFLCLALSPCGLNVAANAAESFAANGAKGTLTVDYIYSSSGRQREEGGYDPYEWKVTRQLSFVVEVAAQAPTAMPTVQGMNGAQTAELKGMQANAQSAAAAYAPMMASAEKIAAKCGNDEACITREVQKMGMGMQGTGQGEAMKRDAKSLQGAAGSLRYQAWRPVSERGTYSIDEVVNISNADPICTARPRHRCTRKEVRKGSGAVPPPPQQGKGKPAYAGMAAVEFDAGASTLTISPPAALSMLPYSETITSDEPEGTYDKPIAHGTHPGNMMMRVGASGSGYQPEAFTVALKGGYRDQSGEKVVNLKGRRHETGTLTVRWRFTAR
jgi:hypothetical protein